MRGQGIWDLQDAADVDVGVRWVRVEVCGFVQFTHPQHHGAGMLNALENLADHFGGVQGGFGVGMGHDCEQLVKTCLRNRVILIVNKLEGVAIDDYHPAILLQLNKSDPGIV